MFGVGLPELLIVFLVCLLLFGANRLPEIGRSLGGGIREFKKAFKEGHDGEAPNKNADKGDR
jgi:sec-independent protein translocase protein TatA